MGCDIHVAFEVKQPEGFELLFPRVPARAWFSNLVDSRVESGAHFVLTGGTNLNPHNAVRDYFKQFTLEEAAERWGHDPDFWWEFPLPSGPNDKCGPGIGARDYHFFCDIAGVRNYGEHQQLFPRRGRPDDLSAAGRHFMDQYGPDGHSHSWLWVRELLDVASLYRSPPYEQLQWLRTFIPDPDNTRMLFYFDN